MKKIKWTVRNIVIAVWAASWVVIALLVIFLPNY